MPIETQSNQHTESSYCTPRHLSDPNRAFSNILVVTIFFCWYQPVVTRMQTIIWIREKIQMVAPTCQYLVLSKIQTGCCCLKALDADLVAGMLSTDKFRFSQDHIIGLKIPVRKDTWTPTQTFALQRLSNNQHD